MFFIFLNVFIFFVIKNDTQLLIPKLPFNTIGSLRNFRIRYFFLKKILMGTPLKLKFFRN